MKIVVNEKQALETHKLKLSNTKKKIQQKQQN